MLLSQSNNEESLLNTNFSYLSNNTENLETNINGELQRLKEEEKYLQAILELKLRKELINHLERDKELEVIKSTSNFNNSLTSRELDDQNMTTTHLLFHKITNECPMCEKNTFSSLVLSSSNERNSTKLNGNETANNQINKEIKKTKPNVVFSKAYKNSRPQYVTNLKTLIQAPIIRDFDSNLRLSYTEPKRSKSATNLSANLSKSVQFEPGTLNSFAKNLTANTNNSERAFAKAFRDKHFYGNKSAPTNEHIEKPEPKFIQLPVSKTLGLFNA